MVTPDSFYTWEWSWTSDPTTSSFGVEGKITACCMRWQGLEPSLSCLLGKCSTNWVRYISYDEPEILILWWPGRREGTGTPISPPKEHLCDSPPKLSNSHKPMNFYQGVHPLIRSEPSRSSHPSKAPSSMLLREGPALNSGFWGFLRCKP